MAEQLTEFVYRTIELFKSEGLGAGSYGTVCKAKCDGVECAAKIMHPVLFDRSNDGASTYQRQFEEECRVLSQVRHPNIVQHLTTHTDPETRLPVLLMELCDESLTAFLQRSPEPLLYHIEVNICHDIALALVYLHSNGLMHRDLTGNNVLMTPGPRAKITDFGMSKLAIGNPHIRAFTKCPGNALYMSPEAQLDKPYTAKLDVFSFGVIVIQILTRQFPEPTERLRSVSLPVPLHKVVPEKERRQAHLQLIPDTHSLKPLALKCLKQKENKRPTALQLSDMLSDLKQSPEYTDNMHQRVCSRCTQYQTEITELQISIQHTIQEKEVKMQNIVTSKDQALDLKKKELIEADEQLKAVVLEYQQIFQQNHKTIADLQKTIAMQERKILELKQQNSAVKITQQSETLVGADQKDISKMKWREGKNAPEAMARGAAAVDGTTAYFRSAGSQKVFSCCILPGEQQQWSQLPDNPFRGCCLVVIDGLLTSVGGWDDGKPTNTLLSLTGEGEKKEWSDIFPPMPTPRLNAACIITEQKLIAVGGHGVEGYLNVVEVMNATENKKWTTTSPLPKRCSFLSIIVNRDILYLAGGLRDDYRSSKSVFTCFLPDYFTSSPSLESRTQQMSHSVWKEIKSLPMTQSTLASFGGHLLAVGGYDHSGNPSSNVYRYDSHTDSWSVISQMKKKRYYCLAVTVSGEFLIVAGGYTAKKDNTTTDSVEILK